MAQTKVQLLMPNLGDVIDFDSSTLFMDGADNRVGIRNTNPQYELDVTGTVRATNFIGSGSTTISDWIVHDGDTNTKFGFPANDTFTVETGGSERIRFDSAGKTFIHGTGATGSNNTSSRLPNGTTLNVHGTSSNDGISVVRYSASYGAYGLNIGRSKTDTFGNNVRVTQDDAIGHITFYGADGTDFNHAAQVSVYADGGTADGTDMPGRLVFKTSPDGSATPVERLRITAGGYVNIGGNYTQTSNTLNVTGNIKSTTRFNLADSVYLWTQNRMSLGNSYIIESQQNTPFAILTQAVAQPIVFGTNSTERLRIRSDGIIQIGNTEIPTNYNV